MKKFIILIILISWINSAFGQYNQEHLSIISDGVQSNYVYKNLALYPIHASRTFQKKHADLGDYVNLKEAIEDKKVVITEQEQLYELVKDTHVEINSEENAFAISEEWAENEKKSIFDNNILHPQVRNLAEDGTAVSSLYIVNTSKDTIYLMAGEVIKGGKQDRIVAKDMLVPPKSEAINLPVFCIEKGRWQYENSVYAQFDHYFSMGSMELRKAVQLKRSQEDVWQVVDKIHMNNKVRSATKNYTALENSDEYKRLKANYIDYFTSVFEDNKEIVGVLVVTGDRVVGCDMFVNSKLFHKQFNDLLQGYATEAITAGTQPSIGVAVVEKYFNNIFSPDDENLEMIVADNKASVFKVGSQQLHIATY